MDAIDQARGAPAAAGQGDYELLDAAAGRRIERFGRYVVDRPAPTAADEPLAADLPAADLVFERGDRGGRWVRGGGTPPWTVRQAGLTLELRPAGGGQVGLFPEHAAGWPWLADAVRSAAERLGRAPELLSLFAYTGGATLTAAAAGARVAHVDGSRPAVTWARTNAGLSGLGEAPVRWLVDDVSTFVARERRRGRGYDGVIADPPSWGHGDRGRTWRIELDLPSLLADVAAIAPDPLVVLVTAHTPGWDGDRLAALVGDTLGVDALPRALSLTAATGRVLPLGHAARWSA